MILSDVMIGVIIGVIVGYSFCFWVVREYLKKKNLWEELK